MCKSFIQCSGITAFVFLFGIVIAAQAASEQDMETLLKKKQPVEVLLKLVQLFENKSQIEKALQLCEEMLKEEPDDHDILLKAAYLHYRLGWLYAADYDERKTHFFRFFEFANKAQKLRPQDYYTSLLLAVAKSKKVGYLPSGDQVRIARELAEDVQVLMSRKSDNLDVLYLSSWLNFEVGRVPVYKKILAAILFDGLPEEMSIEKGFALLEKVIQAKPDSIMYQYDLGMYHMRIGNKEKAQSQFEKVVSMKPLTTEGTIYQHWGRGRLGEAKGAAR